MFANKDQKPLKPSIRTASLSLCRSLSDSIRISLLQKHSRKATAVLQAQPRGTAPVPGQREEAGLRHSAEVSHCTARGFLPALLSPGVQLS